MQQQRAVVLHLEEDQCNQKRIRNKKKATPKEGSSRSVTEASLQSSPLSSPSPRLHGRKAGSPQPVSHAMWPTERA